jgi:hypothetical protein
MAVGGGGSGGRGSWSAPVLCALSMACLAVVWHPSGGLLPLPAVRAEDFVGVPYGPDASWEWSPFSKTMFSRNTSMVQYSFLLQTVIGSTNRGLVDLVVGRWKSPYSIDVRSGPVTRSASSYANTTLQRQGLRCALNWPVRQDQVYYFVDDVYYRMNPDGTNTGGGFRYWGWTGVPENFDTCIGYDRFHTCTHSSTST